MQFQITRFLPYILIVAAIATLYGCDMVEYHPYDTRIGGETRLTGKMIERIEEATEGKDTIRFAVISDTQRWYDETKMLVSNFNQHPELDFVLHLGDLTDFGMTKEFILQRRIFRELHCPYVCLIGNHDCLGTGEDVYHTMFGDDNFSFNASFIHFVALNTNAFEYDYSYAIPNFTYIKNDIESIPDSVNHTITLMHSVPYTEQFNNNIAEYFDYMLKQYPNLLCCFGGHSHHFEVQTPFPNSVPYYICGCAETKAYYYFTLTRDSYSYEIIEV